MKASDLEYNETIRAKGTLTVKPESDTDGASGYPCFEGFVIEVRIDGISEVLYTHREQIGGYSDNWAKDAVRIGRKRAEQLKTEWYNLGIDLKVSDMIMDELIERKAALEAELQRIKDKLDEGL